MAQKFWSSWRLPEKFQRNKRYAGRISCGMQRITALQQMLCDSLAGGETFPALAAALIRFSTRSTTTPIRLSHELIRVPHEYHLAAAQGFPSHGAASELLARRRAVVHHAIGNERSGARARGAARLPAVRPHHAARDAHRVRREIPADRRSQRARARGGGGEHRPLGDGG